MFLEKIKEMLGGSIAENLPDLGAITEQFGSVGEQLTNVQETLSTQVEDATGPITELGK
ncbi:MAG TPA: hypothetical protein PLT55_01420 [Acidimicrobiia bacterium]|jgi:hypothetical protein|nr:hypothetical protein [Acidimicrobiia bacterium]